MLSINLKAVISLKGIENPSLFLQNMGLTRSVALRLLSGRMRNFNPKLIENLCLIFHCTPNDLMEWVPDHPEQANEPLKALLRAEIVDLRNLAISLPFERAGELAKIIEQFKKETAK